MPKAARIHRDVVPCCAAIMGCIATTASAQRGDQKGEPQPSLPAEWMTITSPPLPPAEALERLVVADGFRVECVASEPLIEAPIAAMFAPDGALWVLEMRGFMTDPDGSRELEPLGRVSVLRDTDGDGAMDTASVFADSLILPRAFAFHRDGLLLVEPPHLLLLQDTDGDGRADQSRALCSGFEGIDSPEHAGNGLLWQHDGTYALSQHPWSIVMRPDGTVSLTRTPAHGQWGLAQDDWGRLYYSPNSDALLCDTVPKQFAAQHASGEGIPGVPRRVVTDQRVWPAHLTPGVNRAYRPGFLQDGRLREFTAACGPTIYRDTLLGDDVAGDAFVCEAVGNLVMRYDLTETDDGPQGDPADGDAPFLASTDERFRPVNTFAGPDGALYVVDMARGIVQHKMFVTSFLRKQMEARALHEGTACGRIWRVVPANEAIPSRTPPLLQSLDAVQLAPLLASESGATRDMAQRLLLERSDAASCQRVAEEVRPLLRHARPEVRRLALWTLAALAGAQEADTTPVVPGEWRADIEAASRDEHAAVRAAAALIAGRSRLLDIDAALCSDPEPVVRRHAVAALGADLTRARLGEFLAATAPLWNDATTRAIIVQSCDGLEAEGMAWTVQAVSFNGAGDAALRGDLFEAALFSGDESRVVASIDSALALHASDPRAGIELLARAVKALRADALEASDRRRIRCAAQPIHWGIVAQSDAEVAAHLRALDSCLVWPGRKGYLVDGAPLSTLDRGRILYAHCAGCHGPSGDGTPGVYPPLRGSPFVTGTVDRLTAILLKGLDGRIVVGDHAYEGHMPAAPIDGDADLAALMTYVRQAWGNAEPPVSEPDVASARERFRMRTTPWTLRELQEQLHRSGTPDSPDVAPR